MLAYRKEIDGLRAIAVLSVIFFHAGFETFKGGFVGVDVFFVISGYLITSIILKEKAEGTFTLRRFYERRARRILPALFFVIFCTIPFAYLWLFPKDLQNFSFSVVSALLFCANLYFSQFNGYFTQHSDLMPMLHTWSLSVEEQYYFIFPLIIMGMWRAGIKSILVIVCLLAVISFVATYCYAQLHPNEAFYFLPWRAWEILIGALVAINSNLSTRDNSHKKYAYFLCECMSVFGVLAIFFSIFVFDSYTNFIGKWGLVPVLGTSILLQFCSPNTFVFKVLSCNVLSGIGLISYSMYLWHQPIFAFARIRSLHSLSNTEYVVLIFIVILCAYGSWLNVEKPFRNKNVITGKKLRILSTRVTLVFVIFFTTIGMSAFPFRFSQDVLNVVNVQKEWDQQNKNPCGVTISSTQNGNVSCMRGNNIHPIAALIGDSHANALSHELQRAFTSHSLSFQQMTHFSCPLLKGSHQKDPMRKHMYGCEEAINDFNAEVKNKTDVKNIIISVRWSAYISGQGFDNNEGGIESKKPVSIDVYDESNVLSREERFIHGFDNLIHNYVSTGKKVFVIYPIPEAGWDVPSQIAKTMLYDKESDLRYGVTTSYTRYLERHAAILKLFEKFAQDPNVIPIRLDKIFCNSFVKNRCITMLNGQVLYTDSHHLSNAGAKLVVDEIMKYIH